MKKTIIILVFIMVILTTTTYGNSKFSDVKETDWFNTDLEYATNITRQIIDGYPDGTFKPEETLSVEQFIKMVVCASGTKYINEEGLHWSTPYIEKAIDKNYISSRTFPDYTQGIKREEMARIIANYIAVEEDPESIDSIASRLRNTINDYNEITTNNKNQVLKAYGYGILLGYPDGTYRPDNTLTRAEGTAVIRRIVDKQARKIPNLENIEQAEIEVTYHIDTDTYTVDDSEIPIFKVKDYTLKQMVEDHRVDFSIIIDVTSRDIEIIQRQRDIVKAFLDKKIGLNLSEEIMEYISTKDDPMDNLSSEFYEWEDGKEVQAISFSGNALITIRAWRRTK